jgi:hypothetical protein
MDFAAATPIVSRLLGKLTIVGYPEELVKGDGYRGRGTAANRGI